MKSQIFCPNNRYLEKYGDFLTESLDFAIQEDNNIFSLQIPNLSKRQIISKTNLKDLLQRAQAQ